MDSPHRGWPAGSTPLTQQESRDCRAPAPNTDQNVHKPQDAMKIEAVGGGEHTVHDHGPSLITKKPMTGPL